LASLKQLAGQTLWYGLSTIAARFIGYLQTPIMTYLLQDRSGQVAYGEFSMLYAGISVLNVLFTYGMETAYFRFSGSGEDREKLFRTSFSSLLVSTLVLSLIIHLFRQPLADFIELGAHPEYITWSVLIIAFDTLSVIPFARLRQEGRPRKYAAVRISGIALNLLLTMFFLYFSGNYVHAHPLSEYAQWYNSHSKGGLLLLPNMAGSALTFLLLFGEWKEFRFGLDRELWQRLWKYGSPMIIAGLGGMINETMDRIMLPKLYIGTEDAAKVAVGIYSANYRIAIFISLFVQAFRMSAEPFFFRQAAEKNAPATYARVMKWFVITLCFAFLFTTLYLDIWKHMIPRSYWGGGGIRVVPILLFANICLGIYYNLSVWYKITDNMGKGVYITLLGVAITLLINFTFIPTYGMMACAWATCICYTVMMVISYLWGQKYFPVPYRLSRLAAYIGLCLAAYFLFVLASAWIPWLALRLLVATILLFAYVLIILTKEKQELKSLPFLNKYL
jgi:O-antigen/teichoic acid export membrane protein